MSAANDDDRDAEEFLRLFHRPARPPSPEPEQRAESAGGSFVAHYTVARPVPATKREVSQPGIEIDGARVAPTDACETSETSDTKETTADLAALIRSDSSPDATLGQRDVSTALRVPLARRRLTTGLAAASLVAFAIFVVAAFARAPREAPGTPAPAPSRPAMVAPGAEAPRLIPPIPSVSASVASSASPASTGASATSASRVAASIAHAPPRVVPKPAKDPTTDMLPDEP